MISPSELQMTIAIFIITLLLIGCNAEGDFIHHDCRLPMHQRTETGRPECQKNIPMYSFNPETRNCETRTEKGCPANLNSFNNYYTCISYCIRPNEPKESCDKQNLTTRCNNFEHKYFKFYYDGRNCEQFTGTCQFNGNHYHNQAHCETACGSLMDSTKKAHLVNITPKRKSWCFERYSFTVDDRCISREEDAGPNNPKVKYRFDYQNNSCKKFETNQCTFNGNVFNTIEECLVDCLPSRIECQGCEINKWKKHKAQNCKQISENNVMCNIKYKTFNLAPIQAEVEKLRTSAAFSSLYATSAVRLILTLSVLLRVRLLF